LFSTIHKPCAVELTFDDFEHEQLQFVLVGFGGDRWSN